MTRTFEERLTDVFQKAQCAQDDTLWYSEYETLLEKILSVYHRDMDDS